MSIHRLVLLAVSTLTLAAQSPTVEQRIKRIQDAIITSPVVVKGQAPTTATLAERMATLRVPGVSIAVIRDGRIEWARGFGVVSTGGGPVTADTLFQAASISKPVTALAALRLVQGGKLELDADVNRYLKSWKVPENEFTAQEKVTLRRLLTHTAGTTVHGFPGYASDAPVPTLVQVLDGEKPANTAPVRVDTRPGQNWRYSGGGYEVAQLLLQDVSGQPFPKLMHDMVLAPIGMTRSTYEQPLPKARLSEVALPYRGNGQPVAGGPHTYPEMAAAALWTTPSDLARYAIEVQNALAGKSSRVINAATARMMLTAALNNQGLGPGLGGSAAKPFFNHGGANEGYRCNLIAYQQGDGLVVMTNSDSGGQLASEIQRTVAREYGWPDFQPVERVVAKVDPATFDHFVGAYRLAPAATLTITREGDGLFAQLTGQPKFQVFPQAERSFFLKVVDAQLEFEPGDRSPAVTLHQNGRDQRAPRINGN